MIELRGMTWNHPRGIAPLVAHAADYSTRHPDVSIEWDARSLEDFEAFSVNELASKYDLMVIDHPHVGSVAASGSLVALDTVGRDLKSFTGNTVGRSHETYHFQGHQWALAIDAATQVCARVANSVTGYPQTWDEVLTLAQRGTVACAFAPVHAMMSFFSLCANAGHPCAVDKSPFVDTAIASDVLERLLKLAELLSADCFTSNPIAILDEMSRANSSIEYTPLVYGYVSYSRDRFRARRIEFGDMPGVRGSALGGTGIAVSAKSPHRETAIDIAFELASPRIQKTIYASSGGQPAHREAWLDESVNRDSHNFYRNTIATLDAAYHRPRFDGYIAFQAAAGEKVVNFFTRPLFAGFDVALVERVVRAGAFAFFEVADFVDDVFGFNRSPIAA